MNHKIIKEAFDAVHAEDRLKESTGTFLLEQRKKREEKSAGKYPYRRAVPVFICLFLLVIGIGGHRLYFTPTSVISIDMNPSLELGVNRFDRVISVEGFQEEGEALASSLSVKHMEYTRALEEIMENERLVDGLKRDEILSVSVIGSGGGQAEEMLAAVEACTAGHRNTYCYYADTEEVKEAHHAGLSYGKYRAFLEVQAFEPEVSIEEIRGMTMREIHDLLDKHSAGNHGEKHGDKEAEHEEQEAGTKQEAGHGHGRGCK